MAQAHKFRKAKSLFTTTLSAGISTGTGETITPNSVAGLPTDTEITLTIDRVDSSGTATPTLTERITGIISGGNLTAYTRGIDSSTEQAHSSGAVVEYIWNADDLNDIVDGLLVEHGQTGAHTKAVASDVNAGTSTSKLMHPDGFVGSNFGIRYFQITVFDATSTVTTGDGKAYFHIPTGLNGMNLVYAHGMVVTAGTTNSTTVQINNVTQTADMLTALIEIETGETGSDTSAPGVTIDTANDDVATNDVLRIDVDTASSTAPLGLTITLGFQLPQEING